MNEAWPRLYRLFIVAFLALGASSAAAHEFKLEALMNSFVKIDTNEAHLLIRVPLYLFKSVRFPVNGAEIDIAKSSDAMQRALASVQRDVVIFEDGRALTASTSIARLALPSDRSFENYAEAERHFAEAFPADTALITDQGYVDAHLTYPIRSPDSVFTVRTTAGPELGDYLKMAIRYLPASGEARAMIITSRSGPVALNPSRFDTMIGFIKLGVAHILTGFDHLLFLLCLVIPLRGMRQILAIVTTFTVAHSITLIGSAFGITPTGAWFPPFVEMMIALSIVYMALENIVGVDLRRRLVLTGMFGLVHGFGFSYGLQEQLQFAGDHLLVSLFSFNVGIEVGQILVLCVMIPALALVQRYVLVGRVGTIVLSAIVAHTGWHWMGERWDALSKVAWPSPDWDAVVVAARWIALLLVAGGVIGYVAKRLRFEAANQSAAGVDD
jgi:hypothetical protein